VHALAAELALRRTMDGVAVDFCIELAVAAKAMAAARSARSEWQTVLKSAADFVPQVSYRTPQA
jgi:hypothetical protein